MRLVNIFFGLTLFISSSVYAAPLISAKEAALPAATGTLETRGISRGPAVKLESPEVDLPITSPFDLKVAFEARGESKIDVSTAKVIYLKSPFVDLTPRLKNAITATGIDFSKAEVPPGTHSIRVTIKDTDGRETNSVLTLIVKK